MTGIERLRELIEEHKPGRYIDVPAVHGSYQSGYVAGARDICNKLCIIADQIDREHVSRMRVLAVITEMERHTLGHEGMEDSPVARWARELREALGGDEHDHADEREIIAWVREHGGLDHVKAEWRSRVPYDRYERRRQSLLRHIAECEDALGHRRRCIEELEGRVKALTTENAEMRKRAMPEGMEWLVDAWPRFEDDSPVHFGDAALIDGEADMVEAIQLWIHGKPVIYGDGGSQQLEKGERVRRPVADTWERLEEDARNIRAALLDSDKLPFEVVDERALDLVRRAKALAGDA